MIRLFLSVLCLSLILPVGAYAKGSVKVGDAIPHDLNLKDQTGKMRSFSNLTGKNGLVLVFVRSAEWCPFCQKQLINLSKNNQKFVDAGYNVASVSYDGLPQLEKFTSKNKPKITLLSDPASDSIRAFGILNTASAKGTFSYGIPYPGVYIIDNKKKVQAKFFEADYKDRPSVDSLLKKIKALNTPPVPPMTIKSMGQDPILPGEEKIETPEKILEPVVLPEGFVPPADDDPALPDLEVLTPEKVQDKLPTDAPTEVYKDAVEAGDVKVQELTPEVMPDAAPTVEPETMPDPAPDMPVDPMSGIAPEAGGAAAAVSDAEREEILLNLANQAEHRE